MAAAKIAEVRHNKKLSIVQIKMNKGPNHTLRDAQVKRFLEIREEYLNAGGLETVRFGINSLRRQ